MPTEPPAPVVPSADITCSLYEADNTTLVRTLPHSFSRQWQETLDGPGSGSLSIPLAESAEWSDIANGRVVRCSYRGNAAFSFVPRQRTERLLPGKDAPQVVDIDGPGIMQSLDEAVVLLRPSTTSFAGAVDKRLFGWQCPEFDDTAWSAMTLGNPVYTPAPPLAWPDPFCSRVWLSGAGDQSTVLARRTFTLAAQKVLAIYVSADDGARVWLDGVPLGETDLPPSTSLDRTWGWLPLVSAGTHTIAIEAVDGGGGDRWFACSIYGVDSVSTGVLDTSSFLFHTAYQPSTVTLDPWKLFQFTGTNRPGLTWGSILSTAVTEAKARGRLTGVTLDFDETLDSNGNAWEPAPDFITDIGRTYPELIAQGSESLADTWMDPVGLVIHSTRWRERGNYYTVPSGAPKFTGGIYGVDGAREVNLEQFARTVDLRPDAVSVVGRHRDGYATTGSGPERYADFGSLDSGSAAVVAQTLIDARGDDTESVSTTTIDANDDDLFYGDLLLGDAMSVPSGVPGSETWANARIVALTVKDGGGGSHHRAEVTPELTTALAEFQTLTQRKIDRLRAGVSTDAISAPETLGTGIKGGAIEEVTVTFSPVDSSSYLTDIDQISSPVSFPTRRYRPFRFVARLRDPDVVSVVFDVRQNGIAVHTVTLTAGEEVQEGFMGGIVGIWPDTLDIEITDPGSVAKGLSVEINLAPALV